MRIGIIGQGVVGSALAKAIDGSYHRVVAYALEDGYRHNREHVRDCGIVFICVPTPTAYGDQDIDAVREASDLVGRGAIAVIKSTVLPGTTRRLALEFPHLTVLAAPEFLSAATAAHDAAYPAMNIIGTVAPEDMAAARKVLRVLPPAEHTQITTAEQAELIKYAHNVHGMMSVLAVNLVYDVAQAFGADWGAIGSALVADPAVPSIYARPVHNGGRGAGGACFPKDFAAFAQLYGQVVDCAAGDALLRAAEHKNNDLLEGLNAGSACDSGDAGGLRPVRDNQRVGRQPAPAGC